MANISELLSDVSLVSLWEFRETLPKDTPEHRRRRMQFIREERERQERESQFVRVQEAGGEAAPIWIRAGGRDKDGASS